MTWSYSAADLSLETDAGRINVVRFLVGDTVTSDQQVQDEEIEFALDATGDNAYFAAAYVSNAIAGRYARRVDTQLDGALSAKYSQLQDHYKKLAFTLDKQGKKFSGGTLGISFGGISLSDIDTVRENTDRVSNTFRRDRFRHPASSYHPDPYEDE